MYAVIETGGKQYKIAVGDKLKVEKLVAEEGASVALPRVLMVAHGEQVQFGAPWLERAVSATVLAHGRGGKIRVFKMKRRKGYRRTQGHRQPYTEIQITAIGEHAAGAPAAKSVGAKTTSSATAAVGEKAVNVEKTATTTKATQP